MNTSKPTSPWKSNAELDGRNAKLEGHGDVASDVTRKICQEFLELLDNYGKMNIPGLYPTALSLLCVSKLHAMNMVMLREAGVSPEFREAYLQSIRASEKP